MGGLRIREDFPPVWTPPPQKSFAEKEVRQLLDQIERMEAKGRSDLKWIKRLYAAKLGEEGE